MEGGNELMLCPYCDGTATIDEEPFKGRYIHCGTCEIDLVTAFAGQTSSWHNSGTSG